MPFTVCASASGCDHVIFLLDVSDDNEANKIAVEIYNSVSEGAQIEEIKQGDFCAEFVEKYGKISSYIDNEWDSDSIEEYEELSKYILKGYGCF